jgi:hypothetical protein
MERIVGLALDDADRTVDIDAVVTLIAERTVLNDDVAGIVGCGRCPPRSRSGIEPRDIAV